MSWRRASSSRACTSISSSARTGSGATGEDRTQELSRAEKSQGQARRDALTQLASALDRMRVVDRSGQCRARAVVTDGEPR